MYKAFLIKYGEIGIKGKNRYLFEYALMDQIKFSLRKVDGQFEVTKEQGRVYVEALTEYDYDEVIKALSRVFGIVAICPVVLCDNNEWSNLCQVTGDYMERTYPDQHLSFKVFARRADKSYPKKSMESAATHLTLTFISFCCIRIQSFKDKGQKQEDGNTVDFLWNTYGKCHTDDRKNQKQNS